MVRFALPFLVLLLLHCKISATKADPFLQPALDTTLTQQNYFPFLRYDLNRIEYADVRFKKALDSLREAEYRTVQIIHIGDSHVHADSFTGAVREKLQTLFGRAGHGLLFPFAAAKTHSTRYFVSQAWGSWRYNQSVFPPNGLPIGLSGAVIQTSVPGSAVSVSFYDPPALKSPIVKVFCSNDVANPTSFIASIKTNTGETMSGQCGKPGESTSLPFAKEFQSFTMQTVREKSNQTAFTLFGFSLETNPPGILYHSAGINGARFSDLAHRQTVAPEMIRSMRPDLVILDMGINEVYTFRDAPETFETDVRTSISLLRQAKPDLPILIINLPEIYVKSFNLNLSDRYTATMRKIALDSNCAFYDTYGISGGKGSMYQWALHGLAGEDFNHLTWKGYQVKADLFVHALLKAYLIDRTDRD